MKNIRYEIFKLFCLTKKFSLDFISQTFSLDFIS